MFIYFFHSKFQQQHQFEAKKNIYAQIFASLDFTFQEFSIQIGSKWYKIECVFWLCTMLVKWFEFKNCNFSIDNL